MVEVEIDQEFLETIQFRNEKGLIVEQNVGYGWKPVYYTSCKGYGHGKTKCEESANYKSMGGQDCDYEACSSPSIRPY